MCRALAALGAEAVVRKADVTNERDVRRLLDWIAKSDRRLKGVFHCAGLLDDGILMQMDWPKFDHAAAPKISGGWLLHDLTRELDLDCFVVFSSVLSLFGSAGQANYAAANAFLDALVARRRSEGLPALALNWGPWDDSGLATVSGEKGRAIWRARGTEYISGEIGRQALDLLVGTSAAAAAITITQWSIFLQQFNRAPRLYGELQKEVGAGAATGAAGPRCGRIEGPPAGGIRRRASRPADRVRASAGDEDIGRHRSNRCEPPASRAWPRLR